MQGYEMSDTICALSTPQGVGALGVIRLSGSKSLEIVNSVFQGKNLMEQEANTLHFGKIATEDQLYDEVVVSLFKYPYSYTGEDVVEISCHGSPFIQSEIIKLLTDKGARMAREGEFTLRAFLNGKLDLSQAEAVADLIESDSKVSRELALNQLRGGYSNRLQVLRQKLVDFASMLELELDFSEEDVDFANRDELKNLIDEIQQAIEKLMKSFDQGNVLKQGVPVAIIGEPNVGKSTLLNAILQEERAIVSDIPGTTRDFIEDDISIGGIMFRFIDTAGLRETEDHVESMGIEKTREKAEMAKVVLRMVDVMNIGRQSPVVSGKEGGSKLELYVLNKIDQIDDSALSDLKKELGDENVVYLSAKEGAGVDELLDRLLDFVKSGIGESSGEMVTNIRHLEALKKADEALSRSLEGLQSNISSELVAMDVRQALHYLGEITGEVTTDDLLGNIFSRFCIGK